MANLCGYHLRLNTVELDKTQPSLAVCTLVLAIANGDFSLLIPQIYHLPQSNVLGRYTITPNELSSCDLPH